MICYAMVHCILSMLCNGALHDIDEGWRRTRSIGCSTVLNTVEYIWARTLLELWWLVLLGVCARSRESNLQKDRSVKKRSKKENR